MFRGTVWGLTLLFCVFGLNGFGAADADDRSGIDCNCSQPDGLYKAGAKAKKPYLNCTLPFNPDYCQSPSGSYRVTAASSAGTVYITVSTAGGDELLNTAIPEDGAYWGFSPDDDRFVYHYVTVPGAYAVHHVRLHNLAAAAPETPIYESDLGAGQATAPLFSPHGRYLFYVNVTETTDTLLRVMDTRSGATVYEARFIYATPVDGNPWPGFDEISKWGGVTWGFSPDANDAGLIYVWRSDFNVVEWNLVNLTSGRLAHQISTDAAGVTWSFSPCGDVAAYVENGIEIYLFGTNSGDPLGHEDFTPSVIQDEGIRTTDAKHQALVGGTYHDLADNLAHGVCEGAADRDGDTVADDEDNCPDVANTLQTDSDGDGIGNACDSDFDSDADSYPNSEDNCPFAANADQIDGDGDSVGDVCDNCPQTANENQADSDGNGIGDACSGAGGSAPTWPQGSTLSFANLTETGVDLTWTAAEDEDGDLSGYILLNGAEVMAQVGNQTSFNIDGLTPGQFYMLRVEARDEKGNRSTGGPMTVIVTPDISPPTWPSPADLDWIERSATTLTVKWSAAQDNVGVAGYRIYRRIGADYEQVAQVAGNVTSYHFSCLKPYTGWNIGKYDLKVEAFDALENESQDGPSNTFYTHQRSYACNTNMMRASLTPAGEQLSYYEGPGMTGGAAISADGRYVAFRSDADNLDLEDYLELSDIFRYDRQDGSVVRVNVSSGGARSNFGMDDISNIAISADGRYVAFSDEADTLVPDDTNTFADVFVHDADTGDTVRISFSTSGVEANADAFYPSISGDGRYVVFVSGANNLVEDDTSDTGLYHLFVRDRDADQDGTFDKPGAVSTTRISLSSSGDAANASCYNPAISADGRYVAFESAATNLVADTAKMCTATNQLGHPVQFTCTQVYVHDLLNHETERVSVSGQGVQGAGLSLMPAISADGRYVAFLSSAPNLLSGDNNDASDVFVRDRQSGDTLRASLTDTGAQANADSRGRPAISADGRHVVFASEATNLVPGDTNGLADIFVRDLLAQTTERVNLCPCDSAQANGHSKAPAISADGKFVTFTSVAANLLPDLADTNNAYDVIVHEREYILPVTDLTVTLSDSPDPAVPDAQVTYAAVVSNLGPNSATGVVLESEPAPGSGLTFVSAAAGQGSCQESAGIVTCELGDMDAGQSVTVEIVVTYRGQTTYTHQAAVLGLEYDPDPDNNAASEDTTITMGIPNLLVSPAALDFDDTAVDQYRDLTLTLSNSGGEDLTITAVGGSDALSDPFSFAGASCAADDCAGEFIGSKDSRTLTVRFAPATAGDFNDSFGIVSNDPDQGTLTVDVTGRAFVDSAPIMALTPGSLDFGSFENARACLIQNTGTGVLSWAISPALPDWLSFAPMSGEVSGESAQITVAVDRTLMQGKGVFSMDVPISSNGGGASILIQATKPNTPPVADAGEDILTGYQAGEPVPLNGSGLDPDGDTIVGYSWYLVFAPHSEPPLPPEYGVYISDDTSAAPVFSAYFAGDYTLGLIVNDGTADSEPDTVVIHLDETYEDNQPPVADAGEDSDGFTETPIELDGTGSSDPDGILTEWQWEWVWDEENGTHPMALGATLSDASIARPVFQAAQPGIYTLSLRVVDSRGARSAADQMVITVTDVELEHMDSDGIDDLQECGPDGDNPQFDGNGDGLPDGIQHHVASFQAFDQAGYITMASDPGTYLTLVSPKDPGDAGGVPDNIDFPLALFDFTINNLDAEGKTMLTCYLPAGTEVDTYYKYGPTPDNPVDHWYEFLWDGETGARINGNTVTLYFVDAKRGDDVLVPDNRIVDLGGPAATTLNGGSGGGSGCFIDSVY